MHYNAQKSVGDWERSSILLALCSASRVPRVPCIWGFQVTMGCSWLEQKCSQRALALHSWGFWHIIEMLCSSNSKYNVCFSTCTNSQFPNMCNEKYEAVQLRHSLLDGTILRILWDLENFLTDYEIISWPETQPWTHSVGRQTLFPHNLWLELDRKLGFFNP